jgi:flavodoxin
VNIVIVYESSTGTTAAAAEAMGKSFAAAGHQCQVLSVAKADPVEVAKADLICVGAWVQGLFIFGQHPSAGALMFIDSLPNLVGKQAVVFCTYKIAAGSTLRQLTNALAQKGANVVGQFQYRGPAPDSKFTQFAQTLR